MVTTNKPVIPSLRRAVDLLLVFTTDHPRLSLTELATELGWDKATTYRFAVELTQLRLVHRDGDGCFSLGSLCLQLSVVSMAGRPALARLEEVVVATAATTTLTTQVGLLRDDAIQVVISREGCGAIRAAAELGARLPLHATGLGKAVLSTFDDEAHVRRLLDGLLETYTAHTVTDKDLLLRQVATARHVGFAETSSELSEGLHVLAVPLPEGIFDQPAAICCAGPAAGLVSERVWRGVRDALLDAVAELRPWTIETVAGA